MKCEFKKGDVIVKMMDERWRYLVVNVNYEEYWCIPFGQREQISAFQSARTFSIGFVHSNFVKVGRMKVPIRWDFDRDR